MLKPIRQRSEAFLNAKTQETMVVNLLSTYQNSIEKGLIPKRRFDLNLLQLQAGLLLCKAGTFIARFEDPSTPTI